MDTSNLIIASVTGVLLPLATGLLTKARWPEWVKFIVVVVVAAFVGGVELAVKGEFSDLTLQTAYAHLGVLYMASAASFWLVVSNIPGLKDWLYAHFVK